MRTRLNDCRELGFTKAIKGLSTRRLSNHGGKVKGIGIKVRETERILRFYK
ncbi:6474_t:CDS:2, partial [Ambispora leptoticha]